MEHNEDFRFLDFSAITITRNDICLISKAKTNMLGNSTSGKYIWERGYRQTQRGGPRASYEDTEPIHTLRHRKIGSILK